MFTAWLAWVKISNPAATCGCFGKTGKVIGVYTFVRNGFLIITSFVGVILATQSVSLLQELTLWGALSAILLLGLVGFITVFVHRSALKSDYTSTNVITTFPRRAFLARTFAGIVAIGSGQLGMRTVYAQVAPAPCRDCSCSVSYRYNPDTVCNVCSSLCNRCPPSPCNSITPVTKVTRCCDSGSNYLKECKWETVYLTFKCC